MDSRGWPRIQRGGKKLYLLTLGRKPSTNHLKWVKSDVLCPGSCFLGASVQAAGEHRCASHCWFTPRGATASPALPKPRLWLSSIITLTKPDSYRFLRLLSVPLLSSCLPPSSSLYPASRYLPKANL